MKMRRFSPFSFRRRQLKWGLVSMTLILALSLFVLTDLQQNFISIPPIDLQTARDAQQIEIHNMRLKGQQVNGKDYLVTAARAVSPSQAAKMVSLYEIDAAFAKAEGQMMLAAPAGQYLPENERLWLFTPVIVNDQNGQSMMAGDSQILLKENRIQSLQPVTLSAPMGELQAGQYEFDLEKNIELFQSNITLQGESKTGQMTIINSEIFTLNRPKLWGEFRNRVHLTNDDIDLRSALMQVQFDDNENIEEIYAHTDLRIKLADGRHFTSHWGRYKPDQQVIVLGGNVIASSENETDIGQLVKGDEMIIDLSQQDKAGVVKAQQDKQGGKRVKAVLQPRKKAPPPISSQELPKAD